jgi:hypothetical protein
VWNRFELLLNKGVQQRPLKVTLFEEDDLKILRLFLTKIKLNIEELCIEGIYMMTKEDFELIKPSNVVISTEMSFDISILPSNLESLTLSFSKDTPSLLNSG